MLSIASRSRRSVSSTCASQASRSSLLAQIFFRFFPTVTVQRASNDTNFFKDIVKGKERSLEFRTRDEGLRIHRDRIERGEPPRKTPVGTSPLASDGADRRRAFPRPRP